MQLLIDWNLGNNCNFKCSYCHPDLNNGTRPFPTKDQFILAFNNINDFAYDFQHCVINLTGGEISLDLNLLDEIDKIDKKFKFYLRSNGSASLENWNRVKDKIYKINLTYHLHDDLETFIEKVELLKERCIVLVAITPENWDYGISCYQKFKNIGAATEIQMLFKNHTRGNNIYLDYDQYQWNQYYVIIGKGPDQTTQTVEHKKIEFLNNFYGHFCHAGKDQIVIDSDGNVFRGWCQTDKLGNLFIDNIKLYTTPKICPLHQCTNGFDLLAKKSEGGWGMV